MKRNVVRGIPAFLALSLLLSACGGGASSAASSSSSSSAAAASGSAAPAAQTLDYSRGLTDAGRYDGIRALDYVTLPEGYTELKPGAEYNTVPEEDLQAAVDRYMAQFSGEAAQITDRAVESGDLVNIDYVGSIDGVEFSGGSTGGAGADYTAGSQELIDDFLSQIIGVMPGETVDVNVTFPDPYPNNTDMSGKDALFVTTVNYIHGEAVTPELTDEFVQEYLTATFGYADAAALKAALSADLLEQQQYNYVLDWLYENSAFQEVPQTLVEDQMALLVAEIENNAQRAGVDMETMLAQYGAESLEQLEEMVSPSFENFIRQNLMCQAVAEEQGIEVSEADMIRYFSEELGTDDYGTYTARYGMGYVCQLIQMDLVAELMMESAGA